MRENLRGIAALVLLLGLGQFIGATNFHVTTNGTFGGAGTISSPRSLQRAFEAHANSLNAGPGDTIFIHGGDYVGKFTLWVSGRKGNPLVVMPFQNEVVRIIGKGDDNMTLSIMGAYTLVRDLIITKRLRNRVSTTDQSWPPDIDMEAGVTVGGEGVKLINCIIHDVYDSGIGSSSSGVNVEINGCIIFNAGWKGASMGFGHGMYLSNNTGEKVVRKNIIFNTYGHGIQFYTEGSMKLIGSLFEDNIVFNAGGPQNADGVGDMRNFMIGGNAPIEDLVVRNNFSYHFPSTEGNGIVMGYNVVSESCEVTGNYIARGKRALSMTRFKDATVLNNTIIGSDENNYALTTVLFPEGGGTYRYNWNNNNYFGNQEVFFDENNNKRLTFEEWKSRFKFDTQGSFSPKSSLKNLIKVIPNDYQSGRAHVVVFNWENKGSVSLDLSSVLNLNDKFTIYDVENVFEPLLTGTYDGDVQLPMNQSKVLSPLGNTGYKQAHSSSEFGCFLVISQSGRQQAPTAIEDTSFKVLKCHPNPTADVVTCEFDVSNPGLATAQVYDLQGREVLGDSRETQPGLNQINLNLSGLQEALYIVVISFGNTRQTSKVLVRR